MESFKATVATCVAVECLLLMDYLPGSKPPPLEEMVCNELPNVLAAVVPNVRYDCRDPRSYLDDVVKKIPNLERAASQISERAFTDVTISLLRYTKRGANASDSKIKALAADVACMLGAPNIQQQTSEMYEAAHSALIRAP